MKKIKIIAFLIFCLATAIPLFAGTGFHMKCGVKAEKDVKPCGYETHVTFGGGMFFEQLMGYCRTCNKFTYLRWTREGLPEEMKQSITPKPRPEPLGEIWNAQTGKVLPVYACPSCQGPFVEIKTPQELTHCPSCHKPGFGVDPIKPVMAID